MFQGFLFKIVNLYTINSLGIFDDLTRSLSILLISSFVAYSLQHSLDYGPGSLYLPQPVMLSLLFSAFRADRQQIVYCNVDGFGIKSLWGKKKKQNYVT